MIGSNYCHMKTIRTSHDLRDLWGFGGVTMKVLEVPKCPWIQGVRSDDPDEASKHYILTGNPIFWRHHP
jgi:hypothetical protein